MRNTASGWRLNLVSMINGACQYNKRPAQGTSNDATLEWLG